MNVDGLTQSVPRNQLEKQLSFCQLTENEYRALYYDRMKSQGWSAIADAAKAHFVLAKDGLYAFKHRDKVIATISASRYPSFKIAYIGFFIVDTDFRHKGIGTLLWQKVRTLLEQEGYIIEFDAPFDLASFYEKLGYHIFLTATMFVLKPEKRQKDVIVDPCIQEIDSSNIKQVLAYDQTIVADKKRALFLSQWINKKHTHTVCYIENDEVLGFGIMSQHLVKEHHDPCGYVLAPIYAKTEKIASQILLALVQKAKDEQPIFMDTLNLTDIPCNLAKALGFEEALPLYRLSASGKLDEKRKKIINEVFALSSHAYAPL